MNAKTSPAIPGIDFLVDTRGHRTSVSSICGDIAHWGKTSMTRMSPVSGAASSVDAGTVGYQVGPTF